MNAWMLGLLMAGAGAALGALIATIVALVRRNRTMADLAESTAKATMWERAAREHEAAVDILRTQLETNDRDRAVSLEHAAKLEAQLRLREQQLGEQKALLTEAETRLTDTFSAVGARALEANNRQFLDLARKTFEGLMQEAKGEVDKRHVAIDHLVKPIRELMDRQNTALTELERQRQVAYKGLEEQIKMMASSHERLGSETNRLVTALSRPDQRGQWGEMQLRNVVELAGMTKHCDFVEQTTVRDIDSVQRPDMVVNLPGGGVVVIDAKVPLTAYLDAQQADSQRDQHLENHRRHVNSHVQKLANKQYWRQFERTPKVVVMFVPLESALSAALDLDPELQAKAMQANVLIATPTLLVALLRSVAYGWQQEDVAANARQISKTGKELYERLGKFVRSFEKVGHQLDKATASYNAAVGSLEARLLPSARELRRLHVTTDPAEVPTPAPLSRDARAVTTAELKPLDPAPLPPVPEDVTDSRPGLVQ